MPDRETFLALIRFHLRLGYDLNTAKRLARWACDPDQGLYPEVGGVR